MTFKLIYDPNRNEGPMNIVAFGSGRCSTIEKMIECQRKLEEMPLRMGFRVAAIVTNSKKSKAHEIAEREGIPLIYNNIFTYVREQGLDHKQKENRDLPEIREGFDRKTIDMMYDAAGKDDFSIDLVALAGYMLIVQQPLLQEFDGRMINSHPADLSVRDDYGSRTYTGAAAVRDAIYAGEKETRTSIHIAREEVDAGEILVLSEPLAVDRESLEESPDEDSKDSFVRTHQEVQKHVCDYPAYLFTLENIAEGHFALDGEDNTLKTVIYKGERMPYEGVKLR